MIIGELAISLLLAWIMGLMRSYTKAIYEPFVSNKGFDKSRHSHAAYAGNDIIATSTP